MNQPALGFGGQTLDLPSAATEINSNDTNGITVDEMN
jgi:hypothetical protein